MIPPLVQQQGCPFTIGYITFLYQAQYAMIQDLKEQQAAKEDEDCKEMYDIGIRGCEEHLDKLGAQLAAAVGTA